MTKTEKTDNQKVENPKPEEGQPKIDPNLARAFQNTPISKVRAGRRPPLPKTAPTEAVIEKLNAKRASMTSAGTLQEQVARLNLAVFGPNPDYEKIDSSSGSKKENAA